MEAFLPDKPVGPKAGAAAAKAEMAGLADALTVACGLLKGGTACSSAAALVARAKELQREQLMQAGTGAAAGAVATLGGAGGADGDRAGGGGAAPDVVMAPAGAGAGAGAVDAALAPTTGVEAGGAGRRPKGSVKDKEQRVRSLLKAAAEAVTTVKRALESCREHRTAISVKQGQVATWATELELRRAGAAPDVLAWLQAGSVASEEKQHALEAELTKVAAEVDTLAKWKDRWLGLDDAIADAEAFIGARKAAAAGANTRVDAVAAADAAWRADVMQKHAGLVPDDLDLLPPPPAPVAGAGVTKGACARPRPKAAPVSHMATADAAYYREMHVRYVDVEKSGHITEEMLALHTQADLDIFGWGEGITAVPTTAAGGGVSHRYDIVVHGDVTASFSTAVRAGVAFDYSASYLSPTGVDAAGTVHPVSFPGSAAVCTLRGYGPIDDWPEASKAAARAAGMKLPPKRDPPPLRADDGAGAPAAAARAPGTGHDTGGKTTHGLKRRLSDGDVAAVGDQEHNVAPDPTASLAHFKSGQAIRKAVVARWGSARNAQLLKSGCLPVQGGVAKTSWQVRFTLLVDLDATFESDRARDDAARARGEVAALTEAALHDDDEEEEGDAEDEEGKEEEEDDDSEGFIRHRAGKRKGKGKRREWSSSAIDPSGARDWDDAHVAAAIHGAAALEAYLAKLDGGGDGAGGGGMEDATVDVRDDATVGEASVDGDTGMDGASASPVHGGAGQPRCDPSPHGADDGATGSDDDDDEEASSGAGNGGGAAAVTAPAVKRQRVAVVAPNVAAVAAAWHGADTSRAAPQPLPSPKATSCPSNAIAQLVACSPSCRSFLKSRTLSSDDPAYPLWALSARALAPAAVAGVSDAAAGQLHDDMFGRMPAAVRTDGEHMDAEEFLNKFWLEKKGGEDSELCASLFGGTRNMEVVYGKGCGHDAGCRNEQAGVRSETLNTFGIFQCDVGLLKRHPWTAAGAPAAGSGGAAEPAAAAGALSPAPRVRVRDQLSMEGLPPDPACVSVVDIVDAAWTSDIPSHLCADTAVVAGCKKEVAGTSFASFKTAPQEMLVVAQRREAVPVQASPSLKLTIDGTTIFYDLFGVALHSAFGQGKFGAKRGHWRALVSHTSGHSWHMCSDASIVIQSSSATAATLLCRKDVQNEGTMFWYARRV
jgi:hypothetical protein